MWDCRCVGEANAPHNDKSRERWLSKSVSLQVVTVVDLTLNVTPWPQSESEVYRSNNRCLSAKLVPTFAYRGCHVVSVVDFYGCNLGVIDRSGYYFFQVAPQLYSQGWVDPDPDPLLVRKSGSAGNRTMYLRICGQKLWLLENRGT
jgi:hypothetical protein